MQLQEKSRSDLLSKSMTAKPTKSYNTTRFERRKLLDVAYRLNIAQRTYSHYENGTRSIPLELLCSLADLYNVSTDYILNRTNKRQPY